MELGDIPRINAVRCRCTELGFDRRWTRRLVSTLADFSGAMKNAVHRGNRAIVTVFIEERSVDIGDASINEGLFVNGVEKFACLSLCKCALSN